MQSCSAIKFIGRKGNQFYLIIIIKARVLGRGIVRDILVPITRQQVGIFLKAPKPTCAITKTQIVRIGSTLFGQYNFTVTLLGKKMTISTSTSNSTFQAAT